MISERDKSQIGCISRHPQIKRNAWVIAGTRIPVAAIKRFDEDGYTTPEIIAEYPDLTESDVRAALAHSEKEKLT